MVTRNSAAPRRAWPLGPEKKLNDGSLYQEFKGDDHRIYHRILDRLEKRAPGKAPYRWEVVVR